MILEIKNIDIKEIELNDEKIRRIKKMRLINCKDTYNILSKFINLITLSLYNCEIDKIPNHLIKLEELNIIYNEEYNKIKIKEIPKTLINLKKITIKSNNNININKEDFKKLKEYNNIK